jgi:hypothetical protein
MEEPRAELARWDTARTMWEEILGSVQPDAALVPRDADGSLSEETGGVQLIEEQATAAA